MGRPYANELRALSDTFRWSASRPIEPLIDAISSSRHLPLAAIGSGGSLSAAEFSVDWHMYATGQLARALTPLDVVSAGGCSLQTAVGMFTAGGRNADIRESLEAVISAESRVRWALTATARNLFASRARDAGFDAVVTDAPPAGRDGFLATNSLLMFCVQVHRAYSAAFGDHEAL
ncbi:MAG: sucrose-6-phosphate hydrolase, partial [Acidimicrobiales bacterium]